MGGRYSGQLFMRRGFSLSCWCSVSVLPVPVYGVFDLAPAFVFSNDLADKAASDRANYQYNPGGHGGDANNFECRHSGLLFA